MTFDIGLHEVCVRVGVRYVITKFSRMDSLPNFVTHGAPLRALRVRELRYNICALLYSDRRYAQYQRQVNIFLSLLFPGTTISVSSNRLHRCARTPHARATAVAAPLPFK